MVLFGAHYHTHPGTNKFETNYCSNCNINLGFFKCLTINNFYAYLLIKTCWIKYNGRQSYNMLWKNTASKSNINISFDGLQKTVLVKYRVKSMEPRFSKILL